MGPKSISTTRNDRRGEPIEAAINNKRLKYIIVEAEGDYMDSEDAYEQVEKEVNDKLKEGWKLCGGVSVGNIGEEHFCICQAMIKEEEEYEEEF